MLYCTGLSYIKQMPNYFSGSMSCGANHRDNWDFFERNKYSFTINLLLETLLSMYVGVHTPSPIWLVLGKKNSSVKVRERSCFRLVVNKVKTLCVMLHVISDFFQYLTKTTIFHKL